MADFVQRGAAVDYTPTVDTAGRVGCRSSRLGRNYETRHQGKRLGSIAVEGVFDIEKDLAIAIATGELIYWDEANGYAVTTATGNKLIGKAIADAAVNATSVLLDSASRSVQPTTGYRIRASEHAIFIRRLRMKVVYSFYSLPYRGDPTVNSGNWVQPGIEFLVWAWSVLQTRKWASWIQLVTDRAGAELFGELGIEFDDVAIELDDIEPNGGKLWAIGKLKAYELQDEPFIHLDGDAWFQKRPSVASLLFETGCLSGQRRCQQFCVSGLFD